MQPVRLAMLGAMLGVGPLLSTPSAAQTARDMTDKPGQGVSDVASAPGCPRPAEAKEVKVIDFDSGKSVAKLAVNLGAGRFKLVRITVWDRPDDARPLIPVIEAARITQGNLQFYTPNLNADPESAHDSFIIMTEMGGGYICWATPGSLLNEGAYPVAAEPKPVSAPKPVEPPPQPRVEVKPEEAPAPEAPRSASRTRSRTQALSR